MLDDVIYDIKADNAEIREHNRYVYDHSDELGKGWSFLLQDETPLDFCERLPLKDTLTFKTKDAEYIFELSLKCIECNLFEKEDKENLLNGDEVARMEQDYFVNEYLKKEE